jgi:hypothetical protein
MGYDLGFGTEKAAEVLLTKRVLPVSKASLGLPKGFGKASHYTNMTSYALKGKIGSLPFRVPTPLVGISAKSNDFGIILSRNIITPVGYGVGQLQHFQKK